MVYLYRKNGGQVLGASIDSNAYSNIDVTYYGQVVNPPTPDGTILSVPKIFDGVNIRNATSGEISNFATAEANDTTLQNRSKAISNVETNEVSRKAMKAIISLMVDELNILRAFHSLPNRTLTQAIAAIHNKINNGDVD